ncbi:MAG: hypothetical protein EA425_06160 [Puniceicoccaceae bacterium]|nr:MAG: hypothetical protein EA425_06160 [Puniceicoccaceae bacterium]
MDAGQKAFSIGVLMDELELIRDLALILVSAGLAGMICRWLGVSVVLGYLAAGVVVGPFAQIFPTVAKVESIQALGQAGLVFLMFFIGMQLHPGRLRQMGAAILVAAVVGALLVLQTARLAGVALGLSPTEALFLAGMLVCSSSAIIGKLLADSGTSHEKPATLALGITVMEDLVAVVILSVLASLAMVEVTEATSVGGTLLGLALFVVGFVVAGLLIFPRLLGWVQRRGGDEMLLLTMTGLVFLLALAATEAGYSVTLGAFLTGVVIGEVRLRRRLRRLMQSLRDVFMAVFFVAMGLLIDPALVLEELPLILGLTVAVVAGRWIYCALALVLTGVPLREALKAGQLLTPLGEFALVIAQVGVLSGLLAERYAAVAVGLVVTTALVASLVHPRAEVLCRGLERLLPGVLHAALRFYQERLEAVQRHQERSTMGRLLRPRILQVLLEMLFAGALLLLGAWGLEWLAERFGEEGVLPPALAAGAWAVVGLAAIVPLVAAWRNLAAMGLILAEASTRGRPAGWKMAVDRILAVVSAGLLLAWAGLFLPTGVPFLILFLGLVVAPGVAACFFWRDMIRLHSRVQVDLKQHLDPAPSAERPVPSLRPPPDWPVAMTDFVLPAHSEAVGKSLAELALRSRFGISVVGIDRQGVLVRKPGPDRRLFPGDQVFLVGTAERCREAMTALGRETEAPPVEPAPEELLAERLVVPEGSPRAGRSLGELQVYAKTGVTVLAVRSGAGEVLSPGAGQILRAGDELLVFGDPEHLRLFRDWILAPE